MTREQAILEVADFMSSDEYTYSKCVAKYSVKWRKGKRTIESYIEEAKKIHNKRLEKAKKVKDNIFIEQQKESFKSKILSKIERQEILTQIISGEILSNNAEKIKAISELNKMEGDYAPTKVINENKNIDEVDYSILSDEELKQMAEISRKLRK